MNKYYKFFIFVAAVNLSLCLFNENLYADDNHNRKDDPRCWGVLTTTEEGVLRTIVPSVLQPVGRLGTEMRDSSTIDILGFLNGGIKGVFSFPIDQQKKEIEIEYTFDGHMNEFYEGFLSRTGLEFLKGVLDAIPARFLSEVNKVTVFMTASEDFAIPDISASEEVRKRRLLLERALYGPRANFYGPVANKIILVLPYRDIRAATAFDQYVQFVHDHLVFMMRHKLGYILAYHKYGDFTPDRQWQNAFSKDNENVSQAYGVIITADDFAETVAVYLNTDAGVDHPDITRRYDHRFAILDEIIGLDPSERRRITERNQLLKEKMPEIDRLLKSLGIIDRDGALLYEEDLGIDQNSLRLIREILLDTPRAMETLKGLESTVLALQADGQIDFTSMDLASSLGSIEHLIERIVWPGILFMSDNRGHVPSLIVSSIELLDRLSLQEIRNRLSIFNEVLRAMDQPFTPLTIRYLTETMY